MPFFKMKKYLLIFALLLATNIKAQYYVAGTDPASIKWSKIETEHFKLIFSEKYEVKAQYIANLLEEVYKYGGESLNHSPKKISVVLHNETSYSNGFVTWAPKRMELFTAPNQRMHAQEWLQQLAMHEFRHVVQIDKLNTGFTKFLSYVLGEQAVGGVLGLYVPLWFLEGDAVVAETALSQSGRGRLPWFEQGMRAQIMDKKLYSYEKASFGSYKDYVPNHYEMGYQFVAGARAKYGTDIWEKALLNTGRNPFVIPFNQGQKKESGINKVALYKDVFNDLKSQWAHQDSIALKVQYYPVTSIDKSFVSFRYPHVINDSLTIAELSGPGEVRRFVGIKPSGAYETVYIPGSRSTEPFSVSGNTICWAELIPDTRWEHRYYSVIKTYNILTKKLNRVTHKTNYFAPALSRDEQKIASVKTSYNNEYSLAIIDANTGAELHTYSYGNNDFIYTPQWNDKGDKIVSVVLGEEGKSIVELDLKTGKWNAVLNAGYTEVSLPRYNGNDIVFTGSYSGLEEIYSLTSTGAVKQLTQSKFGANSAAVFKNSLVYSNYTADGYQVVKADEGNLLNKPLDDVQNHSVALYETISEQEKGQPNFADSLMNQQNYDVKKYSKWNLFNVHSWAPANLNPVDAELTMGVSAMSQNLLGSAVSSIGYNADPQMSREKYYFNFQYRGWYPIIDFTINHGDDKIFYDETALYAGTVDTFALKADTKRYQTQIKLGSYIPINLTKGRFSNLLQPSFHYNFINQSAYDVDRITYTQTPQGWAPSQTTTIHTPELNYHNLEYGLYYHHLRRRSARDVTTRWGQLIEFKYAHTPFGNYDVGSILGLRTRLYFPGILKHHAIRIDNNYQYKLVGEEISSDESIVAQNVKYGDLYNYPRGYTRGTNDRMYSFKGDYIFPLINPDLTVPGVMYLKRITTNLFYDYSNTEEDVVFKNNQQSLVYSQNFQSTGLEMRGEFHFFRFLFPVTLGYRYARLISTNQNSHEFLMGVALSGIATGKE